MSLRVLLALAAIGWLSTGCQHAMDREPVPPYPATPEKGYQGRWEPQWIRPVFKRPLPAAVDIRAEYTKWMEENQHATLCYSIVTAESTRQRQFRVGRRKLDTLGGRKELFTIATYTYADPDRGEFIFTWRMRGNHDPSFLLFDSTPREVLLKPVGFDGNIPKLRVLGVEGVGPNPIAF